jgi:hypothetical protein
MEPILSKPRNRCVLTVDLRFFQDDANGEYGLTHRDTMQGENGADGFNAFYDAQGLFHDIFEHHHENTHKYFRGQYAMNIGGEMAAMGAMWYYYSTLGLYRRLSTSYHAPGAMMRQTTESLVCEAIGEGYCNFGYTLESNVPKQKPIEDSELEYQIKELYTNAKKYQRHSSDPAFKADGEIYRKSVTFRKVADLHRWGYRYAQKLVPHNYENQLTLHQFFDFWGDFCKRNPAEELANLARGIQFKLYRNQAGLISWKAWILYGSNKVRITKHFSIDDLYSDGQVI